MPSRSRDLLWVSTLEFLTFTETTLTLTASDTTETHPEASTDTLLETVTKSDVHASILAADSSLKDPAAASTNPASIPASTTGTTTAQASSVASQFSAD